MVRVNIMLDQDLYNELSTIRNKSEFIRDAFRDKLRVLRKKQLQKSLKEGYKKEGKNLKEWETTIADGWD